jgi:hypothetical protein
MHIHFDSSMPVVDVQDGSRVVLTSVPRITVTVRGRGAAGALTRTGAGGGDAASTTAISSSSGLRSVS